MIRIFVILLVLWAQTLEAKIPERYSSSKYCVGCHVQQGKDWKSTWHSRSNRSSNILYAKVLDYMASMSYKSAEDLEVNCAQCHSPKMGVKKVDASYAISKALGIETQETKAVHQAIHNETAQDGISCIICHNIANIKQTHHLNTRGFEAVTFGPSNVMSGPFKESHRTTYHKMVQKSYFRDDVNTLCKVCHDGYKEKGVYFYATGLEYDSVKSDQKCVDCHMSKHEKSIIAPIVQGKVKAVERETRAHLFKGARNSDILKSALKLQTSKHNDTLLLDLENITPHKLPTGFTGREIVIEVSYYQNSKRLKTLIKRINTLYVDKHGAETLAYIATKMASDTRLNPYEKRTYKLKIPTGATQAKVAIWYRLVKKSLVPLLHIKDPIFVKKYPIIDTDIAL
ncbi:multiheme c-type cytochrome [Sulfurospirillum sp. 1612]|uniref:multiheme c-type cytochrome n=1 Tax=Sulfurospirillum sp. 1612 TaxID=3094835 RepID=UPI002F941340